MGNSAYSRTRLSIVRAILVAMASASGVQAADDIGADTTASLAEFGIPEIIVTAQKRSEDIRNVPVAITTATGQQLLDEGITNTSELTKLVPSFTYRTSDYGTPVFAIRGVGFDDFSLGAGPTVTVYVDQVPLPFSVMTRGTVLDVERVEVLKGPQGTFFGENSTGGAVNYIAAKPTTAFAAGADVSYGRFNDSTEQGYISGPIAEGLTARLSAELENADGWQQSSSRPGDTLGKKNFADGRLLLDWKPMGGLGIELNLSGWRDRSDTPAAQFEAFTPSAPRAPINAPVYAALENYPVSPANARAADWDANTSYRDDANFYLASLRGDWEFADNFTLSAISAYSHYKSQTPLDADGTAYPDLDIDKAGLLTSAFQELRLTYSGDTVKWMLGANYQKDRINESDTDIFYSTNVSVGPYYFPGGRFIDDENVKTASAFGSLDYKLTNTVTAQASIRYSDQKRAFEGCFADLGNGAAAAAISFLSTELSGSPTVVAPGSCLTLSTVTFKPLPIVSSNLDQSNVPWRLSLDWKVTSDTTLYTSVTKGFKAGSYSVPAAVLATQLDAVTQESVLSYEAGFKSWLAGGRAQLSGATFYYDYRNKQLDGNVLNPVFGPLQQLINVPKSRVVGSELEMTLRPWEPLRISGGVTYLDSRVLGNPLPPAQPLNPIGDLVDYVGESFPNTPRWLGVTDAEYSLPLGDLKGFLGSTVTYRSQSNAAFGDLPLFRIDGYAVLDARLGIQSATGKWRAQLYGRNVTDKYYWTGVSRNIDTVIRFAGMPATYGVEASFRY
jgi:iron complex outermembrane receptor protein